MQMLVNRPVWLMDGGFTVHHFVHLSIANKSHWLRFLFNRTFGSIATGTPIPAFAQKALPPPAAGLAEAQEEAQLAGAERCRAPGGEEIRGPTSNRDQ